MMKGNCYRIENCVRTTAQKKGKLITGKAFILFHFQKTEMKGN